MEIGKLPRFLYSSFLFSFSYFLDNISNLKLQSGLHFCLFVLSLYMHVHVHAFLSHSALLFHKNKDVTSSFGFFFGAGDEPRTSCMLGQRSISLTV